MIYTLPELKKELKAMHEVTQVTIWIEEFGEGFNVYTGVEFTGEQGIECSEYYDLSEEEKISKAEGRAKRAVESLVKAGYQVKYEGVTTQ